MATVSAIDKLLIRIEKKRNLMMLLASKKGFTHVETIAHSQELDNLLIQYQKMILKKRCT